ncbi:hypothetical protein GCM10027030_19480 [Luteococcus sediminum]
MDSRTVTTDDGVRLHVGVRGSGPDVVVLSGGPGCIHYLAGEQLALEGLRCWYPDPRGVGRSGGCPHDMGRAIADLEDIRRALGVERWIVLGHSWGSDLAVRYALDHPRSVRGVVGMCGHGLHDDRGWAAAYRAGVGTQEQIPIDFVPEVHASLWSSFKEDWIRTPALWRRLADCDVPMSFVAAGDDIRPSWPVEQLAVLVPRGRFRSLAGLVHDFWTTDPRRWVQECVAECRAMANCD